MVTRFESDLDFFTIEFYEILPNGDLHIHFLLLYV